MRRPAILQAIVGLALVAGLPAFARAEDERPPPGTPITDPGFDPPVSAATHPVRAPTQKILFVNFDGGLLNYCGPGVDDPIDDCSTIFQGAVIPYTGDAAARTAVIQSLRQDLADFDIIVTTERPPDDVEYDMEMVGDWYPLASVGFAGIAPKIDCFDGDGGDVSFTLETSAYPQDIAKVILQEVAHTWGLEHVDAPGDLLYPTTGGAADPRFEARCSPIVRLGGGLVLNEAACPEQHAAHCDEPDHQSSHADILALFGPASADTEPPVLEILSPVDGTNTPHDFHLVLEIADAIVPQTYLTTLEIGDLYTTDLVLSGPGVFPVAVSELPDGHFVVRVTAADEAGNLATAEVEIDVGEGAPPEEADDTSDVMPSGTDDLGESPDTGATDDGTSGIPVDGGGGCSCFSAASAPRRAGTRLAWLLPLLLPLRPRGRRVPRPGQN